MDKDLSYFKNPKVVLSVIVFIFLLTLLAYSNSFKGEFVFDDILHFFELNKLTGPSHFHDMGYWMNITNRPLAFFTFSLNYYLHGTNVWGYHFVNFVIHLIAGFFVFLLIRKILRIYFSRNKEGDYKSIYEFFIPLGTMAIFLLHPIQTGSVSYIIQRMASMLALFYIMSVYFYLVARVEHSSKGLTIKSLLFYLLSIITLILGVLTKENAATIPVAMLLTEICFVRNKNGKPYYFIITTATSIFLIGFLGVVLLGKLPVEPNLDYTRTQYLFTQFRVMIKYFQLLIFPINQNVDYDFSLSESFFEPAVLISFIIVLLTFVIGLLFHKKNKLISFMIFWFYLSLAIESSIIPIRDVIFEHRLYLSMISFAFLFNYIILSFLIKEFKLNFLKFKLSFFVVVLIGVNIVYSILTYRRNFVWQSGYNLWSDTILKSPNKARPNNNLGREYRKLGDYDKAIYYYERAIDLDPSYAMAYNNLGAVYHLKGDTDSALEYYQLAVFYDSGNVDALTNLGIIYQSLNQRDRAKEYFDLAYQEKPNDIQVLYNIAVSEHVSGNINRAQRHYNRMLELDAFDFRALYYGAITYLMQENYSRAIELLQRAERVQPDNPGVIRNLMQAYTLSGNSREAETYRRKLENISQ